MGFTSRRGPPVKRPNRQRATPFRNRVLRVGASAVGAVLSFAFVIWLGQHGFYNFAYADEIVDPVIRGFVGTLSLVAVVIPVGFTMGLLMGWARTSGSLVSRTAGGVYVEFFRSMPPLTLIAFTSLLATNVFRTYFYVDNPVGIAVGFGTIALAFHSGAYQTEIIRAGILSVPAGQIEAADAIGLPRWRTLLYVVLPQAFRVSLPALGNEFSSVIKDTSLLSAISAFEMSFVGSILVTNALTRDFNLVFILWAEIALLYFVLTFAVTRIVRFVESRSKVPGLEAPQL